MLAHFLDFFYFTDPNVRWVALGAVLICATTGGVGVFVCLQKRSLVGDTIAHAMLPGVAVAFLLTGTKQNFALSLGAIISGGFAWAIINYLIKNTKLKSDTVLALVLSVFYGFGVMLLTYIQQKQSGQQAGLDKFLFGKIASTTLDDLLPLSVLLSIVVLVILAGYQQLKIIIFDVEYAKAHGYGVVFWETLLALLVIAVVATGIQAVGVILLASLLITPALVARYWTTSLWAMLLLASLVGAFSGLLGAYISYLSPKMPTGPWIVIVLSVLAFASVWRRK